MSYAASRFSGRDKPLPLALVAIIAVHGVALVAVASAKLDLGRSNPLRTTVINIPLDPPATEPPPPARREVQSRSAPRPVPSDPIAIVPLPGPELVIPPVFEPVELAPLAGPGEGGTIAPPRPAPPVRVGPRLATAADQLRPPYPAAKLRAGEEATLRLRLAIDARGRVTGVEPVGAADPTFLAAARAHILRHWRYAPASEDGAAVATTTVITLSFTLEEG